MKKKILILSGIKWSDTIQRHQRIASFLSENSYEVLFWEGIVSSKFSFEKLYKRLKNKIMIRQEKINKTSTPSVKIISTKFLNPHGIFKYINRILINRKFSEIGKNYDVVINYLPIETTDYILKKCKFKTLVYDCVRDFSNWGGYPEDILFFEEKNLKNSDFIFVDSYYLKNKITSKIQDSYKIKQLLPTISMDEFLVYQKYSLEVKEIKRLTYFGTVDSHINVELLNELSKDYIINVIGKINKSIKLSNRIQKYDFQTNLTELAKLIMEISDAIILPYVGNIDGVIPAKLLQSLATGLPVYISSFYDSNCFKDNLYIFKDLEELKSQINEFEYEDYNKKIDKTKKLINANIEERSFKLILDCIEGRV